jgi:hypothetical protein
MRCMFAFFWCNCEANFLITLQAIVCYMHRCVVWQYTYWPVIQSNIKKKILWYVIYIHLMTCDAWSPQNVDSIDNGSSYRSPIHTNQQRFHKTTAWKCLETRMQLYQKTPSTQAVMLLPLNMLLGFACRRRYGLKPLLAWNNLRPQRHQRISKNVGTGAGPNSCPASSRFSCLVLYSWYHIKLQVHKHMVCMWAYRGLFY